MSRSYKKYAGHVDRCPWAKNQANRRIRRATPKVDEDWVDPVPCYRGYRKYYESWNISDFSCLYYTYEEYARWERRWIEFQYILRPNESIKGRVQKSEDDEWLRKTWRKAKRK